MKVLGIESSSLVASVALVTDDILTAEYTVNFDADGGTVSTTSKTVRN